MAVVVGSGLALSSCVTIVDSRAKAQHVTALAQIENFSRALLAYREDAKAFPAESTGLRALRLAPAHTIGWNGPYVQKDIPLDPWGHPYIYRLKMGVPEVGSYGADGKPGGEGLDADILAPVI